MTDFKNTICELIDTSIEKLLKKQFHQVECKLLQDKWKLSNKQMEKLTDGLKGYPIVDEKIENDFNNYMKEFAEIDDRRTSKMFWNAKPNF